MSKEGNMLNKLDDGKKITLGMYLKEHIPQDRIEAENLTYAKIAALATKGCKFLVTPMNIKKFLPKVGLRPSELALQKSKFAREGLAKIRADAERGNARDALIVQQNPANDESLKKLAESIDNLNNTMKTILELHQRINDLNIRVNDLENMKTTPESSRG